VTKTPVRAGVYYSPEFSAQVFQRANGSSLWVVPIGATSVRLFDELYPRVFDKTARVTTLSAEEFAAQGVDVVIAPSFEHFDFRLGMDADSDRYSISYRMTLYSNQGVPVTSWIVFGNAQSTSTLSTTLESWINDDMTDAATKFLQGFEHNAGPALAAMTGKHGEPIAAFDLNGVTLTAKRADLPALNAKQMATLQQAGVVPLKITAQSQTRSGLVVRASDMRLRLTEGGQPIEPSSVSSVLNILEGTSQAGGVTAALTGAAFGVLVTYLEEQSNQKERELQFRAGGQSAFEDRTLSKGKEETGIVLFRLPQGTSITSGTSLTAWVVDPTIAAGGQMNISFGSGFADKETAPLPAVAVKGPVGTQLH